MLFLDTSALVKRYLDEDGREHVLALMAEHDIWVASRLARAEADIVLCREMHEAGTSEALRAELAKDWNEFAVVAIDDACMTRAAEIGCLTGLRTLDAIHLAAADLFARDATFVTFDRRLGNAALELGFALPSYGLE